MKTALCRATPVRLAAALLLGLGLPCHAQPTAPVAPAAAAPPTEATPAPAATPAEAATPAPSPSPTPAPQPILEPLEPRAGVDALSDTDIRQALELLRTHYLDTAAVSEEALARASLQGVLERLGPGITLAEKQLSTEEPSPVRAEILDDRIGYIRVGALTKDHLAEFDAALGNFAEKNLRSLILDFRATPAAGDYELAAEYIKRLTPKGKLLFAVRRPSAKQEQMFTSNQDPVFQGLLVSLVSPNTAGAAEVIPAVLRTVQKALVIGGQTAGEAAEFSELPLRGGKVLRVAVAEVKLAQETSIFPEGLKPDLAVPVPPAREARILAAELEKGVSGFVFESERPRLNEAALVAGTNPEIDETDSAPQKQQRPLFDSALQRAVDLITTLGIFDKER